MSHGKGNKAPCSVQTNTVEEHARKNTSDKKETVASYEGFLDYISYDMYADTL